MSQGGQAKTLSGGIIPSQVATQYVTDAGTATPSANVLNVNGLGGASTAGFGNTITVTAAAAATTTYDGNSGSATPAGNILNITGTGSLLTAASGNTVAASLAGLTNHSVLVGAGTDTITKLSVGTNGQVLLGATGADPAFATLTSSGGTITFTPGVHSLNLEASGAGVTTLTGNSGGAISPTAGNINIVTANSTPTFVGSGSTLTLDFNLDNISLGTLLPSVTTAVRNVNVGQVSMGTLTSGNDNCSYGQHSLRNVDQGNGNACYGSESGNSITSGSNNVAVGYNCLGNSNNTSNTAVGGQAGVSISSDNNVAIGSSALSGGASAPLNVAIGVNSLASLGAGGSNTAVGTNSGVSMTAGSNNIFVGNDAGSSYTTSESSNINVGNAGTIAESNVMRLGTDGSGSGQVNTTYIAGVAGVAVDNAQSVFVDMTTGQFGSADPNKVLQEFDDFLSDSSADNSVFSKLNWVNTQFASFALTSGLAGHPGIAEVAAGRTSATLSTSLNSGLQLPIVVGGGQISINWVINLLALSAGGNTYDTWIGLGNGLASLPPTEPSDGIYFRYTDSVNGGKWQIVTASGSSYTKQDSGIAASTNWVNLGIVVNAAGTSVSYFIDGAPVSTAITTNIPSIALAIIYVMVSSAGTLPQSLVDLMYYKHILTTPR